MRDLLNGSTYSYFKMSTRRTCEETLYMDCSLSSPWAAASIHSCCSCWCCCCCWLWDGFSQWKKARMCVFFVGVVTIRFVLFSFVSYKAGLYSLRISRLQPKIHFDLIWFKYYELLNWFYFVLVFFLFFLCFFFVFLLIVV